MLRKIFAYAILAVTVLWLVFSYIPVSVVTMPQIAYPLASSGRLFQYLLVGGFVLFVLLQIWLVVASARLFRTADGRQNQVTTEFGLNRTTEIFWTAIPLLMTIGLALAGWQMWSSLALR